MNRFPYGRVFQEGYRLVIDFPQCHSAMMLLTRISHHRLVTNGGEKWGLVLAAIALLTGVLSYCPLNSLLGLNTCRPRNEPHQTGGQQDWSAVLIDVPQCGLLFTGRKKEVVVKSVRWDPPPQGSPDGET